MSCNITGSPPNNSGSKPQWRITPMSVWWVQMSCFRVTRITWHTYRITTVKQIMLEGDGRSATRCFFYYWWVRFLSPIRPYGMACEIELQSIMSVHAILTAHRSSTNGNCPNLREEMTARWSPTGKTPTANLIDLRKRSKTVRLFIVSWP